MCHPLNDYEKGQKSLQTLAERDSLLGLSPEGHAQLTPALAEWLLRAESEAGSELVYLTEAGRVKALPLNSFFNFPERYSSQMPHGAFVSAELADGSSRVRYVPNCQREDILAVLETLAREVPLRNDRPLRERILDKLTAQGHLAYLSQDGLEHLNAKVIKYIDYAMNLRPGSELIYFNRDGHVKAEALEKVLQSPEKFADLSPPFYLAFELDHQSVLLDTQDISPSNLWHLQRKAREQAHP